MKLNFWRICDSEDLTHKAVKRKWEKVKYLNGNYVLKFSLKKMNANYRGNFEYKNSTDQIKPWHNNLYIILS